MGTSSFSRGVSRLLRAVGAGSVLGTVGVLALGGAHEAAAQGLTYASGQSLSPAFEGWGQNSDGSFNLMFGYMNRNWEEIIDVAIGPGNTIEPGGPDQGQPTHFQPRRNRFVFRIRVPADFGDAELVWTLTTNGQTEYAYATLKPDYFIDKFVLQANNGAGGAGGTFPGLAENTAPALTLEGEASRTAEVGQPVTLAAIVSDDNLPRPRFLPRTDPRRATSRITTDSASVLRVSWFVYRGAGPVRFDPPQIKLWEDTRDGENSPWSPGWRASKPPDDGRWVAQAIFDEPGTYVLQCLAHDGGLSTTEAVTITVTP